MRVVRWVLGVAALAALAAFVWGLVAPRRKAPETPTPTYIAPEPAEDRGVSVPGAVPLTGPAG